MLGQQVTGTDQSGNSVSGVVSGIQLTSNGPLLNVGSSTVPFSSVTSVTLPGSSAGTGTQGAGAASSSGGSSGSGTSG